MNFLSSLWSRAAESSLNLVWIFDLIDVRGNNFRLNSIDVQVSENFINKTRIRGDTALSFCAPLSLSLFLLDSVAKT